ncbi:hypothetical protein SAMN00017405_0092 [Desulfonispora thiosulfatigenes DSM 11270]|uniref:UPF0122 protein SAMN00017405_0092 n=1 Tax=Desulfonispora thiosulfatigenes DSM 11270 TaxID=656914 RepID=A0A1W1VKL8_DESTI|nr:putative DNA-binding protein [Desulfonispora thiosulfatigenes]SMB93770.1 hypothetical protein SAMN00017405_0092 [Desulfonispora thiosulfatigenes DSM 11270]
MTQIIEKRAFLCLLFDFYGALLTEKQKFVFDLYYHNDLSLVEIAQEENISRQAVYDILKRSENILYDYEDRLHLASKFIKTNDKLVNALNIINNIEQENNSDKLGKLKQIIHSVLKDG